MHHHIGFYVRRSCVCQANAQRAKEYENPLVDISCCYLCCFVVFRYNHLRCCSCCCVALCYSTAFISPSFFVHLELFESLVDWSWMVYMCNCAGCMALIIIIRLSLMLIHPYAHTHTHLNANFTYGKFSCIADKRRAPFSRIFDHRNHIASAVFRVYRFACITLFIWRFVNRNDSSHKLRNSILRYRPLLTSALYLHYSNGGGIV